jgi:Chalcone isomerase like
MKKPSVGAPFILRHPLTVSIVDPATSITFPRTMRVPSKVKLPTMTLVGVGVRSVSFLGVKVYSVAFYADLDNPNLNVSYFDEQSTLR